MKGVFFLKEFPSKLDQKELTRTYVSFISKSQTPIVMKIREFCYLQNVEYAEVCWQFSFPDWFNNYVLSRFFGWARYNRKGKRVA